MHQYHIPLSERKVHSHDNATAMQQKTTQESKKTMTNVLNKSQTHSGVTPHKVRSSHDELKAADICKPARDFETGMKE